MAEHLLLQPPDTIEIDPNDPLVFLGGPIQGAPAWQYDAVDIIHGVHSGIVVASPRKEYTSGSFRYYPQVNWERYHLDRAGYGNGAIMFYLPAQTEPTPGRAYGQTSRVELGMWIIRKSLDNSIQLAVGMPGGFGNERYLKHMIELECPETNVIEKAPNILEETCKVAAQLAIQKAASQ